MGMNFCVSQNLCVASCNESVKLDDAAMSTDPESDDENVPSNHLPSSPHTPKTPRSLCFELSSTIVCSCSVMDMAVLTASSITSVKSCLDSNIIN